MTRTATRAALAVASALAAATLGAATAPPPPDSVAARVVAGARAELALRTTYDLTMGYYRTSWKDGVDTGRRVYPGGDIAPSMGVCVEVPIRAFRAAGVDLQRLVHEDMARAPAAYKLGDKKLDTNIDHRRVGNLLTFFRRHWASLPTAVTPATLADWRPGDVVVWSLGGTAHADHIGVVSDATDPTSGRPLVIHNYPVPGHVAEQDVLLTWKILGHFRWKG